MIKHIVMWKFKEGHEEEMNKRVPNIVCIRKRYKNPKNRHKKKENIFF